MIEGVIIKKLKKFDDQRGWLAEFYRQDETGYRPVMAYISVTNPGQVRGPHEHVNQSDYFVFVGPGNFEVHFWDRREGSPTNGRHETTAAGEIDPCLIIVPPGVVHGYKCISDIPAWGMNLPDKLWRGEGKKEEVDEIRWETDPDSSYKIA
jgi:dTDP-4-dehydrorhamnose 3,5-epimerase